MAEESTAIKTPFDWLHGGLFFGRPSKQGLQGIDNCKDTKSLIQGLAHDLECIIAPRGGDSPTGTVAAAAAAAAAAASIATDSSAAAAAPATTEEDPSSTPSPSAFFAARAARLRFLLYDERAKSSQQQSEGGRRTNPTMAGSTVQILTGEEQKDLLYCLLNSMSLVPFESRKHVAAVINYLLVAGLAGADASLYLPIMELFRDHVAANFNRFMSAILTGQDPAKNGSDVVLHCGSIYRSCLRHPMLYRKLVETTEAAKQYVFPILDEYVHVPNFEISSDAMESLRCALGAAIPRTPADEVYKTEIATTASEFLTRDYEAIWDERFNPRLLSDEADYMTRRVALQMLSAVLLTRSNYTIMIRYVANRQSLIVIMKLLRDTSPHITLDAFHVFKVFVANPNKPPEVVKILKDNQSKLAAYLRTLHQEKEDTDTQFRDEKALIISTIESL
jgi:calcium binding protein 39